MNTCPKCNRTEDETEFYTKGKNKYCRECWRTIVTEWKKTERGKLSTERAKENKRNKHRQTEQYIINQNKREDRRIRKAKEEEERISRWKSKLREREMEKQRRINSDTLQCVTCGETKDNTDFYKYKNGVPRKTCKTCQLKSFAEMKTRKKSFTKVRARKLVNAAVESGELLKPNNCSYCGESGDIQAHHDDYSKPLDVNWYCDRCHRGIHKILRGIEKVF